MIDFSAAFTVDWRALELERRVILSLYLHGAQEAGFVFTSESGLIQNSWVGKFQMVSASHTLEVFGSPFRLRVPSRATMLLACLLVTMLTCHDLSARDEDVAHGTLCFVGARSAARPQQPVAYRCAKTRHLVCGCPRVQGCTMG